MPPRRRRALAALVPALAALLLSAGPAGAWDELVNTGKTGFYEGPDENFLKGAICHYDTSHNYWLDRIDVRTPQPHSYYNHNQKIGYRFIIERDTQPYDASYSTYYKSKFIYDTANMQIPASWATRIYTGLPSNPTNGHWRVKVVLKWVKPGTASKADGRVVGVIEAYKSVAGPDSHPSDQYCSGSY